MAARLRERRGLDDTLRPSGPLLWLHGASVGEAMSVLGVAEHFLTAVPDAHVLFTTNTVTSAALVAERLPAVLHRFVPLDVPSWGARFLDHWRPDAAAFVESEIWPNLLHGCRVRDIPVVLLNGRLSNRSFRGWRRAPGFAGSVLDTFERIDAQSAADAARFRALGARTVRVAGNLKFAAPPLPAAPSELSRLRAVLDGRPVWLAASTHPGEEDIAAAIHAELAPGFPGLLTIVAPRHPERGDEIAKALDAPQRSRGEDPPHEGVWVVDTLGELGLWYRLARVVFVGGSLVAHGGQNPLEPARLGCAIAAGPHMFNFADPVSALRDGGGITEVAGARALTAWVAETLRDAARRERAGEAACAAASRLADLPERVAQELAALVQRAAVPA
jgi:3-deoxy-D-manno-octulosonic-acid transferase